MKVFGRELSDVPKGFVIAHIWYFIRCFLILKHPISFLYCYLTSTCPKGGSVQLRDGTRIILSSHPHDVITVFVIFCRRDYGFISPHSVLLDLGASIGVFSLYAALCKAKKVYAYEPNTEAYECLCRNISENGLEQVIIPYRFALSHVDKDKVKIPLEPSPYNAVLSSESSELVEWVETRTLQGALNAGALNLVDLVKLDCEGAEYDILFHSAEQVFEKIREIRLEYHRGGTESLISHLKKHNFELIKHRVDSYESGTLWFSKSG